jgi:hypothetical protein
MAKKQLILVRSDRMDGNKKEDRNEHGLVRMSKVARDHMGFKSTVEVYPQTNSTEQRLKGSMLLEIFQAFTSDIRKLREEGYTEEQLKRVGFVSSRTYQKIVGSSTDKKSIWITEEISDTVIGADPEFLLFDEEKKIVRANNVLSYYGPIGCDGAMAEIRPKPAILPEELVDNIKELLMDDSLVSSIKKYDWVAGCYYKDNTRDYPIGGHIHIGNPIQVARINNDRRMDFFKSFNKILDELLAIPMIKIDGADLGRARRTECSTGKYGYFGEWRPCNGRLEHRTLSGMWLMHPTLATLVLGVAKAIIDEVYRHIADKDFNTEYMFPSSLKSERIWSAGFEHWDSIPLVKDLGCVLDSREMIELLHKSSASKITAKYLNSWYSRMKRLTTYKIYSKYIDGLYEVLKNKTETFHKYDKRLQSNWLEGREFLT